MVLATLKEDFSCFLDFFFFLVRPSLLPQICLILCLVSNGAKVKVIEFYLKK